MKEEREWAVEAGNADRVEAPDAGRARDVPRHALNTASSGDGMSKANGLSGPSGMFATLTAEDLCLWEDGFTLVVESSRGDVVVRL